MHLLKFEAHSFNRVFQNLEKFTGCILSAFRENKYQYNNPENIPTLESLPGKETSLSASRKENRLRNELLEKEIIKSGLGFNKCIGGYIEKHDADREVATEESFIVYNTKYRVEDFINLMVELGSKFDQDSILITQPKENKNPREIASIQAWYVATSPRAGVVGSKIQHFDSISIKEIKDYFTKVFKHSFQLKKISNLNKEDYQSLSGSFSRHSMDLEFESKYPNLALKREGLFSDKRNWN